MTDLAEMCQFDAAASEMALTGETHTPMDCSRVEMYLLVQEGNPVSWRACTNAARHIEGWIRDTDDRYGAVPVLTLLETEDEQ